MMTTVKQLRAEAKAKGLSGYSRLRRDQLLTLLKKELPPKKPPIKREEIKVKKGDRITVGHAIINIYTGGSGHPDYPIPQSVVKSALDANNLNPQHQREVLNLAQQAPPAPAIKKGFVPPTPPEIVNSGWKGREVKEKVVLTPAQIKAQKEAEARAGHMNALAEAIAKRRAKAEGL